MLTYQRPVVPALAKAGFSIVRRAEPPSSSGAPIRLLRDFSRLPATQVIQRQETSNPPDMDDRLKKQQGQVQTKRSEAGGNLTAQVEGAIHRMRGQGQPLEQGVQRQMESAIGADFSRVRVHTNSEADTLNRSVNALAFTTGSDIFFRSGMHAPQTQSGRALLAHELTHVVQQSGAAPSSGLVLGPANDAYEQEADSVASSVIASESAGAGHAQPQAKLSRMAVQRRGGATVGQLSVNTNVVGAGLTAGHAWLAYTPAAGTMTSYGTWGNRTPIGLHRDLELGYSPAATRITDLDATDHGALTSFAAANNDWGYINNCATFAARGWRAVAGESLSYRTIGIPNPSALGKGIVDANGGTTGVLPATPATPRKSSGSL
jgi:hypothetical protein